jgi:hypothetical protein
LISGKPDRRYRPLAWSTVASLVLHAAGAALLATFLLHVFLGPKGGTERLSETTKVTIERVIPTPTPTPVPTPTPSPTPIVQGARAGAIAPARAVPPPAIPHTPSPTTKLAADQRAFAKEVASLNAQNDVHAIPTIDPSQQASATKQYGFSVPHGLQAGNEGNGVITPTQSWHEKGEDCYYGRYSFVYGDGSMEAGNIVWPFCYDPGDDPFHQGRHQIPFPPPLPGYRLPPGTDLPPLEKDFYEHWIDEQ